MTTKQLNDLQKKAENETRDNHSEVAKLIILAEICRELKIYNEKH